MIDFLKYRSFYAVISVFLFVIFIGNYTYKYYTYGSTFIYSVDFTGGTQVLLEFAEPVTSAAVVKPLENAGIKSVSTREFSDKELLVRVASFSNEEEGVGEKIQKIVQEALPANQVTIKKIDSIYRDTLLVICFCSRCFCITFS